ncbi:MAG: DUF2851 family protein [Bacteroidota bacterium]
MINEEFLSYVWRFRLCGSILKTTDGEEVEVLHPGHLNTDSGPDFTNARVRIADTLWAGNIEIHVNASDWKKHGHQDDDAYNTVILHVVYNADATSADIGCAFFPTIELAGTFDYQLLQRYEGMQSGRSWIPCAAGLNSVEPFIIQSWLNNLVFERFAMKTDAVINELNSRQGDWEQCFYIYNARAFGFGLNAQPFELLARSLPLQILARHKDDIFQLEALLFGQAGLLHQEFTDDYPVLLQKEYFFLRNKWQLQPLPGHTWKFHRLRPAGFPTLRLAQFASLIYKSSSMLSEVLECTDITQLTALFDTGVSDYWLTHYNFDAPTSRGSRKMSRAFTDIVILNAVVPFLFALGRIKDDIRFTDRALSLLDELPVEKNNITQKFDDCGIKSGSALQSQALLQLKNAYCNNKRCLDCRIGHTLLNTR